MGGPRGGSEGLRRVERGMEVRSRSVHAFEERREEFFLSAVVGIVVIFGERTVSFEFQNRVLGLFPERRAQLR